ncbi:xanthine dehydrogenase family protein subunit M [Ruegeria sp.]|uniref:FAD binding domain-containing protein n=1 Tax=Ruegeria sp. TaxID=1879320 RepID=UPI002310DEC2|nr:xanthine dehydrogenase family protein subunit M [Ruegeria sp.]MDA7966476.1 xanthine dehydrogenase family protein subunit M [Ruegeria sp.]
MSYHLPTDLEETLILRSKAPSQVVAGCTDYFPAKQQGQGGLDIVDISRVAQLSGIDHADGHWRIGATTRWSDIARADLPPCFDGLRAAAREVGSIQIQNLGTIGGNLCNASPAADAVPPLLTLEAGVELRSVRGVRELPLDQFVTGNRKTALADDEVLTAVIIRNPPTDAGSAFQKLGARRYLVISIVMTAALIRLDRNGRIDLARLAVGACSATARRLPGLEQTLIGQSLADVNIDSSDLKDLSPIDDIRGTADYRLEAAAEQCMRAIRDAAGCARE